MRNILFVPFFVIACASPKPPAAVEPPPAAAEQCAVNQFVACKSGEDCARSRGKLIHAHECHDRAAAACQAAGCVHGCDIHNDDPKEIHCSANAAYSSHMKKCAGYSNLGCPENMTCQLSEEAKRADDAFGDCVPAAK